MENTILNNFNPLLWGFEKTIERCSNESINVYYQLDLNAEISIHLSCTYYKNNALPQEQAVEISVESMFSLLPHITDKFKLASLIRALAGKSHNAYKNILKPS